MLTPRGGGGINPGKSWWGCAARFSTDPISDQNVSFSTPVFRPGLWAEIISQLPRLERTQKNSSNPFRIRIFLFLSYLFGIDLFMGSWPLYRYGGHFVLLKFNEYYGIPGGDEHIPKNSLGIYARLSGYFFLKFSYDKIVIGKKIVVTYLDVIMIAFFPRNIQWRTIKTTDQARKRIVLMLPGHPIILIKSN